MADARSNLIKLLSALVSGYQDLENTLQDLLTKRQIGTAVGVQLDQIGKIVGQPRQGQDDDTYRRYCRARIATNRSDGTVEDLIRVSLLVLGGTPVIDVASESVATVVEEVLGMSLTDALANALLPFLVDAVAAGVRPIEISQYVADSDQWFFALSAFATGSPLVGDTAIAVDSTTGFPPTGSLNVDEGTSVFEVVTYTGTTPTSFIGVSALAHNHPTNIQVAFATGPGKGMGDTGDLTKGGEFARATDAPYTAVIVP